MEVKLLIDGEEVPLEVKRTIQVPVGKSVKQEYDLWGVKNPYQGLWSLGPLFGTIYKTPGWKPSQGLVLPMPADTGVSGAAHETKVVRNEPPKELKSFDFFLRHSIAGKGPKAEATCRAYLYTIETFQRYLGERGPTPELAKEFIADLKKTNSSSSLNVHIAALTSYFSFLGLELTVPRFSTYRDNPPILSDEDWQRILTTTTEPVHDANRSGYGRFRALFELCVLCVYCDCGLRPSEAIRLKVEDVLDEGYLRVARPDGNFDLVPVSNTALNYIKDYIQYRGNQEPYLFPGDKPDSHMANRTAQGIVNRLFQRARMPDARVRNIKYRTIQLLRKIGASGREIKAQIDSETS